MIPASWAPAFFVGWEETTRYCGCTAGCWFCRPSAHSTHLYRVASAGPLFLPDQMRPVCFDPTWRELHRYAPRCTRGARCIPPRPPRANHPSWAQRARAKRRAFIHRLRRST